MTEPAIACLNIYCVLAFGGTPYFFYNIQMINWKDNNCTIDTMKRRLTKSQCHWFTYSSRCDITYTYGINTQSGSCAIMYEPLWVCICVHMCVCMWILGVCVWTCDVLFAPHDSYISSSGQNVTGWSGCELVCHKSPCPWMSRQYWQVLDDCRVTGGGDTMGGEMKEWHVV